MYAVVFGGRIIFCLLTELLWRSVVGARSGVGVHCWLLVVSGEQLRVESAMLFRRLGSGANAALKAQ